MNAWFDREEALRRLGVRPQTLYAYVSRGLIERRCDPTDPRRSLYGTEDVLRLAQRGKRGRAASTIAAGAMAWGEPVISTSLSTVARGRLLFRGTDAVEMAETATLEEVAAILWDCPAPVSFPSSSSPPDAFSALAGLTTGSRSLAGRPAAKLVEDARTCVAVLAAGFGAAGQGPMHSRLAAVWRAGESAGEVVRRALVLLADHELNASTFAVRVAASTGASMPACMLAGLCALSGPRHGGAGAALAALLAEVERVGAESAVARWLADGMGLPGFNHPLYPLGDPRGAALLETAAQDVLMTSLREAVAEATGGLPNVDFGLLAALRGAGIPDGAGFGIFAIARSVGWAAHAIEQSGTVGIIRPRAAYVGASG